MKITREKLTEIAIDYKKVRELEQALHDAKMYSDYDKVVEIESHLLVAYRFCMFHFNMFNHCAEFEY